MSKHKLENHHLLLAAILLIGAYLRLMSLDHSLWPDEALYAHLAEGLYSRGEISLDGAQWIGQPPFFIALVALSYSIFGNQELSALIVSPFIGTMGILGVYLLSKEAINREIGLLSAFFIAIMPSHWLVSRMIVADITATTLLTFSLYFLIAGMKHQKISYYILLGISMGLLVLTKKIGLIIYPILIITIFLSTRNTINTSRKKLLISFFISVIIQFPWYFKNFLISHDPLGNSMGYVGEFKDENILTLIDMIKGFPDIVNVFMLFFSLIGIFIIIKDRSREGYFLLAAIGIFIILFLFHKKTELTRYLVPITPFFAILAGVGLYSIKNRISGIKNNPIIYLILIMVIFSAGIIDGLERIEINRQKYSGYEEAALWIDENLPIGSKIITNSRAIRYYSHFETEYFPEKEGEFLYIISRENQYAIISQWPTDPATPNYIEGFLDGESFRILKRINENPPYIYVVKGNEKVG